MITPQMLLYGSAIASLIMAIPAIVSPKKFKKVIKGFFSDTKMIRISGMFGLIISFLFLSVNWRISGDLITIISIMGWLGLAKSTTRLWFPEYTKKMIKRSFLSSEKTIPLYGILVILGATALVYLAIKIQMPAIIAG